MSLSDKKHILFFCPSPIYGGVERYIESRAKELSSEGNIVTLFFLFEGRFYEKAKAQGLNVHLSPLTVRLKNPFSWLRFQFYFHKYLKEKTIDVIQNAMPYSQIFAALPARLAGVKIEWFQHGPIGGPLDRVADWFPVDTILFNSEYTKEQHLHKVGTLRVPSQIVKMTLLTPVDHSNVDKIKAEYSDKDHLFICSGRITRWKGFEIAIAALINSSREGLGNFYLLIVGEPATDDDKKYLKELKKLVSDSQVKESFKFLGFREDVFDYVAAADALIHSAHEPEPFGLVVAEALNLGTYVFAPDIGGVKEQLLLAQSRGSLFDHENPVNDLKEKLLRKYL